MNQQRTLVFDRASSVCVVCERVCERMCIHKVLSPMQCDCVFGDRLATCSGENKGCAPGEEAFITSATTILKSCRACDTDAYFSTTVCISRTQPISRVSFLKLETYKSIQKLVSCVPGMLEKTSVPISQKDYEPLYTAPNVWLCIRFRFSVCYVGHTLICFPS